MSRYLCSSAVTVALLGCASGAFPQTARPERPYRGLFANGAENASQSLLAKASIATGYDDNLLAGAAGGNRAAGVVAGADSRGILGQGSVALTYSHQAGAMSFGASAATTARYYPSGQREKTVQQSHGQIHFSAQPRNGTAVSAHLAASQQADTFSQAFASGPEIPFSEPALPDLDTASAVTSYLAYDGTLGVSQSLTRRTKVGGSYGFRRTQGRGDRGEFAHQRAGGLLSHQLGRGLSLRAGYTYSEAGYPDGRRVPNHVINAGLDYNRALSFSRRTTLAFGTGTAATRAYDAVRYTVVGDARLNHEIGRSWLAYTAYNRRVLLHETWQEPVLANSVTAGVNGLVNRRVSFSSSAHTALGNVGDTTSANKFNSWQGQAAVTLAITRHWNAALTYAYYRYGAADGVLLPDGYPKTFRRQSIRATVNVWGPLFQRGRRSNVTG